VISDTNSLVLLPAVGGTAVRLRQGEAGSPTAYGTALEAALGWQDGGAASVHLAGLDAAFGRGSNRELIAEVIGRLDIAVELSGGIRDDDSLNAALATGCARAIIATAALEQPDWLRSAIARHGEKIALGLDVRDTTLTGRGGINHGGDLFDVLARLDAEGCARRAPRRQPYRP
jgi:phosphoribosyl isomerase A